MTEVMVRARRQHEQWPRDPQFLRWLARFRFCAASVLEARFAMSARKAAGVWRHPAGLLTARPTTASRSAADPVLKRRIDAIVKRLGDARTIEVIEDQ